MFRQMDGDTEVHDPNTCRRLYLQNSNDIGMTWSVVAWPCRVEYLLHDEQIHVLVAPPLCPFPSLRPLPLTYLTSSTTTQCPRIRTSHLLQPLLRISTPSSQPLWRNTKSGRRKTSPPIAWPPRSRPATLPMPLSPCFKPKSRRLINLRVPMNGGRGCWTRPSPYCAHSPGLSATLPGR